MFVSEFFYDTFRSFYYIFAGFKFYHIAKNQIETVRSTSIADNCWMFFFYIGRRAFFILLALPVTTPKTILPHSLSNSSITFSTSDANIFSRMALQVGVERFLKYWFGLAYNKVNGGLVANVTPSITHQSY